MLFESIQSIANIHSLGQKSVGCSSSSGYSQSNDGVAVVAPAKNPLPLNLAPNALESVYHTLIPKQNSTGRSSAPLLPKVL
ncbi:hypothetical protein DICPUDRAFT_146875 [Dictyostelium purpureum]|uniref:Uncharacterized protein n=1 Tax=Dictyostelium purpureum TaxID=5786 RepID=F0Z742_DICPU|nr:uncharacterized protein DICPUDRAFT_146875 [Dictyostelium purpureum]EGC40272.1 hypothetical protein DICPUDRAFT_146875 [Dictyostelium purpureum]|eukprot:XP_003283208.1 hypothetical protein DICPUDRAFT_146875 [Dictyostelium purpureum]